MTSPDVELVPPEPRAHLRGTVELLGVFRDLSGGHRDADALFALVDRPESVPAQVERRQFGLKYDCYLARSAAHSAWGIAINDRFEGRASLDAATADFVAGLPGTYDYDQARRIEERFADPGASTTVAVGFDHPDRPPRLKVYLQEELWGTGLATLGELAEETGVSLPSWLDSGTRTGVATVGLLADGTVRLKTYLGGSDPIGLARSAPAEVQALAAAMASSSPAGEGWYYLTIRFDPSGWRYAVNKIYNAVQIGFTRDGGGVDAAWADVGGLFEHAGQLPWLTSLRADFSGRLRVVPTATAVEAGPSVDVYCAAWEL